MTDIVDEIRRAYAPVGIRLLYAAGLLGCGCGHQRECTRALDAARWQIAQQRYGD